ncbi:hypothetical protein ZWY2020_000895, partial [Hordeum vulgare]
PSSSRSAPPSLPARFFDPGLYRPLSTLVPWLAFRVGLCRRVFSSPGSWSRPWEFPIHHGRRRQGLLHGDVKDANDLQLLTVLYCLHHISSSSRLRFTYIVSWLYIYYKFFTRCNAGTCFFFFQKM